MIQRLLNIGTVLAIGIFTMTPMMVQAEDDGVVCAAIYACKEDGSVDERFAGGACGPRYKAQCDSMHREDKIIAECSDDIKSLEQLNKKLKKRLRAEQRKARKLK